MKFKKAAIAIFATLPFQAGCVTTEQITGLRQEYKSHEQVMQQQVDLLNKEVDKIWRGMHCTNARVAEFLTEIRNCDSETCATRNIEQMLNIMLTEQHVLLRLPASALPKQSIESIAAIRVEQLRQKLGPSNLRPHVSRVLVMTMPLNMNLKTLNQDPSVTATVTGRFFKKYLAEDLKLAPEVPSLGPYPVTCKNKSQIMERYARMSRDDKAVTDEPKPTDPQIAIWVFKVDC